jgi:hypothetical protein
MSQIAVKWHVIPDGISAIVQVTIKGEFTVNSATATTEAEKGIAKLISRISTESEDTILGKLVIDRWVGDYERPEEPAAIGGQGSRACMPRPADASVPVRSLPSRPSRRDPMPFLLIGGLAWIALMGIWGVISLAQFLWEIGGGK